MKSDKNILCSYVQFQDNLKNRKLYIHNFKKRGVRLIQVLVMF